MVKPIFLSPQVKQSVIISNNKHGIYELPYELRNNIRLRILGNYERSGKCQNIAELLSPRRLARSPPPKKKKSCRYQQKAAEKRKLKFSHEN